MEDEPVFENLPNFRQAGGRGLKNKHNRRIKDGLLFRSSRTDFVTTKDKSVFQQLGIRSILDLRRQSEYERSDGDKALDDMYQLHVIKKGEVVPMKPSLRWGKKSAKGSSSAMSPEQYMGKRYLVNMWTMKLIWHEFEKLNFFIRYLSLILVVIDWLFGCHIFVKLYTWLVLNEMSVADQYLEVLEYTQPVICDILRFLSDRKNLPALVHCAHGKDRTGIIVALVLGCLGVEDDKIVEDYVKSEDGLACIKQRVHEEICTRYGFSEACTRAEASTMKDLLSIVNERYGSIPEYLVSAGFSMEEQKKLKQAFLKAEDDLD